MADATTTAKRTTDLRERKLPIKPGPPLVHQGATPIAGMMSGATGGAGQGVATPVPGPQLSGGVAGAPTGTTTITPDNTLRNQRLGFDVQARDVAAPGGYERVNARDTSGSIKSAFDAQLPALMQQFKDESRQLVQRTAAMGRTGSGLFNRDTGFVGDRALQARESLLGNLTFQATQADANRALQAAMGNQSAGLQSNSIAAQIAQANANRALQVDMARQAHWGQQQSREDMLANQAMQNQQIQAMLLGQGFQGAPTGAVNAAAGTTMAGAEMYGANAGQLNSQIGNAVNQAVQAYTSPATRTSASVPSALPQLNLPDMRTQALQIQQRNQLKPNRPDLDPRALGLEM